MIKYSIKIKAENYHQQSLNKLLQHKMNKISYIKTQDQEEATIITLLNSSTKGKNQK